MENRGNFGRESCRKFSQTASAFAARGLVKKSIARKGFTYYNADGDLHGIINMITASEEILHFALFRECASQNTPTFRNLDHPKK